jgi:hypothetical protein
MATGDAGKTRLLPTTQAGQALKRSGQTVRRLLASGQLQGRKIGDRWLVEAESIADYRDREQT